jgi:hypothetical protein
VNTRQESREHYSNLHASKTSKERTLRRKNDYTRESRLEAPVRQPLYRGILTAIGLASFWDSNSFTADFHDGCINAAAAKLARVGSLVRGSGRLLWSVRIGILL